jgi:hypothetical protein
LTLEGNEAVQRNGLTTNFTGLVRSLRILSLSIANLLQVLTPVAIAIAYLSMPVASISFKSDPKHFIVVILCIMASVSLLFLAVRHMASRPRWWKKITAWVKKLQLDGMDRGRLALRRGRNDLGRTADGVEMDNLEV